MLPAPVDLGLPAEFTAWREGQPEAIVRAIDTPARFAGLVLPTGFGKSLVYMAVAVLQQARTVILTSTKALQRQLLRDFGDLAVIVQGQSAYVCHALEPGGELFSQFRDAVRDERYQVTVDRGPCHAGVECKLKLGGCSYFDALRAAVSADIVITNYAWWLTLLSNPQIKLQPELLVLDEAHDAPDQLASALGATIPAELLHVVLNERLTPAEAKDAIGWVTWAQTRADKLKGLLEGTKPTSREALGRIRAARVLWYACQRIARIDPRLLLVSDQLDSVKFDVVWAAGFAEEWLFRHVPRVLLTSATMTTHTAELLGIMAQDLDLYEAGDGFPRERRPVYIAPAKEPPFGKALRVDHRMTPEAEAAWIEHIDTIIDRRRDRNGIIHTTSYRRRDVLIARSRHRASMLTHAKHDTAQQILKFKRSPAGTVLVSPSVTTGYDFPGVECEYCILAKVPFPDSRDPVTKARSLVDPRYPAHVAMQEIVQAIGRGMRAAADQQEAFIVDAHAQWFLAKHADLAPKWFRRAVKRLDPGVVPAPPPPLTREAVAGSANDSTTDTQE